MKSVMAHNFSTVPRADIQRSSFNRSHGYKTTFSGGKLIPVFVDEALPGDTFNLRATFFGRLATPLKPIMDNLFLESFFFAVPMRLLWDNWQRFNGEQTNPTDTTDYVIPQLPLPGGVGYADLADYFGIPTDITNLSVSALPFRAYNLIWHEWFRDQNLQTAPVLNTDDGPDAEADFPMRNRGKRHDYFTSCLPWPQKGPAVEIPLGTLAPVIPETAVSLGTPWFEMNSASAENGPLNTYANSDVMHVGDLSHAAGNLRWKVTALQADLSSATGATINSLREAFQIQKIYERDARGGTRYTEIVRAHFGVVSPDARLQRPEYLGGGSSMVNISPVPRTSAANATDTLPQGNLAGFGIVNAHGHGFTKSFTEHCVVIGLISVRADLTYQRGIERMWSRSTRFDFYWPALANIGEQAVLNKEIYAQGTAADDQVFGYQERYAEYRYKPSLITGKFRSDDLTSLDIWHLSQDFGSLPTLSDAFIKDEPPIDRISAVVTEPHFLLDAYYDYKCARPMPTYSVPGLIDHF